MVNFNLIISPYDKNQNKIYNNNYKFSNLKLKYKIYKNLCKKDITDYSHNWTITKGYDYIVYKPKNNLEKAIDRIKQNLFNNKTHIKFNSSRIDDINKSIKIPKNKVPFIIKYGDKKSFINSNYLVNKMFSPKLKATEQNKKANANKEELSSGKLISFQKKNRLLFAKNIKNYNLCYYDLIYIILLYIC